MRLVGSKSRVLGRMARDLRPSGAVVRFDPTSPDPRDQGRFVLARLPARVVERFSGWYAYLASNWFEGRWSMPHIHSTELYWDVLHIQASGRLPGRVAWP